VRTYNIIIACWIGLTGNKTFFAGMAQWTVQGLGDYFQSKKCFVINANYFPSGLKAICVHAQWVLASNFKINKNHYACITFAWMTKTRTRYLSPKNKFRGLGRPEQFRNSEKCSFGCREDHGTSSVIYSTVGQSTSCAYPKMPRPQGR